MIFPSTVDGWLTQVEGEALNDLATGKSVLEIGSYCGRSTICIAQSASSVCSIDPHNGHDTPNPRDTYDEFVENLKRYNVAEKVLVIRGYFDESIAKILRAKFDLIFIDGDHRLNAVRRDILNAKQLLTDDGLLAFHDYRVERGEYDHRWDAGVTEAVNDLLADGHELVGRHGTIAVVKSLNKASS